LTGWAVSDIASDQFFAAFNGGRRQFIGPARCGFVACPTSAPYTVRYKSDAILFYGFIVTLEILIRRALTMTKISVILLVASDRNFFELKESEGEHAI